MDNEDFQKKWEEVKNTLLSSTDKLGAHIDSRILDTVITLNLSGVSTTQSCEGHIDHSLAGPWIIIGTQNSTKIESIRKQMVNTQEEAQLIASQKPLDYVHDVIYIKKMNQYRILQKESLLPTLENIKRLTPLIEEYYATRQVPFIVRLILSDEDSPIPRLRNQGIYLQDTETAKNKEENLLLFQNEMTNFTNFLVSKLRNSYK